MKVVAGQSPVFLRPDEASIRASAWTYSTGEPVGRLLPDWDPATSLELRQGITIDDEGLLGSSQLGPDSLLRVAATWQSSATRLRGSGEHVDGTANQLSSLEIRLSLPGTLLGGTLTLRTQIVTIKPEPGSRIAAAQAGDILWEERARVVLEGEASRFPVNVVAFDQVAGIENEASWALSWSGADFNEPFGASLRLLINSSKSDVVRAVTSADPSEMDRWIRGQIRFEVARALVTRALRDDQFLENPDGFEEGTVGQVVRDMLLIGWGAAGAPSSLAARLQDDPALFDSELQSRFMETG